MPPMLVVIPLALSVTSAALLLYALRGRRVDDHPICRKCGFDLFGRAEGSTRCSECGSDLARPRAVRVGRRRTRRRLLSLALPLLLLSAACLGLLGWGAARGVNWDRHKPVWWLMAEARGGDVPQRDSALIELTGRMVDTRLSDRQVHALVDVALDVQADPRRAWTPAAGDVVAKALGAGKLSHERWQRYLRQGAALGLRARATVRRGDPLVYAPSLTSSRLAAGHRVAVSYQILGTDFGGVPSQAHQDFHHRYDVAGGNPAGDAYVPTLYLHDVPALPDGRHLLRLRVRVRVGEFTAATPAAVAPGYRPDVVVDETRELTAPVTLVPEGAVTVKLNRDESLRPAVEGAIEAMHLHAGAAPGIVIDCREPAVDLAYTVLVRRAGKEWELGDVVFPAGRPPGPPPPRPILELPAAAMESDGKSSAAPQSELVLRPSIPAAVGTLDMTEIWAGEVVFRGLDLRREVNWGNLAGTTYRPAPATQARSQPGETDVGNAGLPLQN